MHPVSFTTNLSQNLAPFPPCSDAWKFDGMGEERQYGRFGASRRCGFPPLLFFPGSSSFFLRGPRSGLAPVRFYI